MLLLCSSLVVRDTSSVRPGLARQAGGGTFCVPAKLCANKRNSGLGGVESYMHGPGGAGPFRPPPSPHPVHFSCQKLGGSPGRILDFSFWGLTLGHELALA